MPDLPVARRSGAHEHADALDLLRARGERAENRPYRRATEERERTRVVA